MTTNETDYESMAAKVKAAGLRISGCDLSIGFVTIYGRDCLPHFYNWEDEFFYNCNEHGSDEDSHSGTIDDCIAAVLATEPPQAPAGPPWRKGDERPSRQEEVLFSTGDRLRIGDYSSYVDSVVLEDEDCETQLLVDWCGVEYWLPTSEALATIPTPHPTDQE